MWLSHIIFYSKFITNLIFNGRISNRTIDVIDVQLVALTSCSKHIAILIVKCKTKNLQEFTGTKYKLIVTKQINFNKKVN